MCAAASVVQIQKYNNTEIQKCRNTTKKNTESETFCAGEKAVVVETNL